MAAPQIPEPSLITGEQMSREEFLRRWEALPGLKNAELIEGVVYVSSPVSIEHGRLDARLGGWLVIYAWATPGCETGHNATWIVQGSAPQPDIYLAIPSEWGGQSVSDGVFWSGAPELAIEVCVSSTEVDFGPKLALYQRAGVREYITVESFTKKIVWRYLEDGSYRVIEPEHDGSLRSRVFAGLWLHTSAFWAGDGTVMNSLLQQGLASEEHAAFVQKLIAQKHG